MMPLFMKFFIVKHLHHFPRHPPTMDPPLQNYLCPVPYIYLNILFISCRYTRALSHSLNVPTANKEYFLKPNK